MCLSVPQIAAAATRISTSSGPGVGTGQSRTSVPDAPSTGAVLTTACMASGRGCYHVWGPALAGRDGWAETGRCTKTMQCADHAAFVALPAVFVQPAFDAVDHLHRRGGLFEQLVAHP